MKFTNDKSLYIVSLGCPKNTVDTELIWGSLFQADYYLVSDIEEAEYILVNTCGFIEIAKEESIDAILEAAILKTQGKCRYLVVAGCLAQRYATELCREIPEIDALIGVSELERALEIFQALESGKQKHAINSDSTYRYDALSRRQLTPPHYAYLKVAEGCNQHCTFCAIPLIRGKLRSRSIDSCVSEAKALVKNGVKELIVVSQNTTDYGRDLTGESQLSDLLRNLAMIEGLEWLRVMYYYPDSLTDEVLEVMASFPNICKYVDLPLQHVAPNVLKRMGRPNTPERLEALCLHIRDMIPGVTLRTTFLVGFPGETVSDFKMLCEFVEKVQFERLGVFGYSHEEGTAAYKLNGLLPSDVIADRRDYIMGLQSAISQRHWKRLVGRRLPAIMDGVSLESADLLEARLMTQALEIDGVVYINDGIAYPGELVTVEITDSHIYDGVGRIVEDS